jgi:hypothetical protein
MIKYLEHIDQFFDEAYQWLCKRRKNYPPDADIWGFKRIWEGLVPTSATLSIK